MSEATINDRTAESLLAKARRADHNITTMDDYRIFEPEAATNFYDELQTARQQATADIHAAYQTLNRLFLRIINQNANFSGVTFSGPFAKTDYLLKEHHAPKHLQRAVNDARARFANLTRRDASELEENFAYDHMAICQFVALIYRAPIPSTLEATFPKRRATKRGELKAECIRIIVNRWDDTYIYANADATGAGEVKVHYGGRSQRSVYEDWDWSYLKPLLRENCQINIVRPREHDGVLYPELMIWEPDYLVDISAIAACFESYGVSALTHLMNKLKPAPNTSAILLGNLASQMLDEELSCGSKPTAYEQSVMRFFKANAIKLLTTPLPPDFHDQARSQKKIIRETLTTKLPDMLRNDGMAFDSSEVMVEPSFFSEMLGIQGRMDFLHLDNTVLIEQKSGKGGFRPWGGTPPPDPNTPAHQEKHYVQLLLYMLLIRYNFRKEYEANDRKLFAYLLYSKYQNGLLPLGFAPNLIFSAIKVRNEITANEYSYTGSGLDVLTHLNSSWFQPADPKSKLWTQYQKPQIDALLTPIHEATELERAYYLRFLRFIETEHLMSKVGNNTKANSGFADKWHSTLEEKQLAGNIYCDLEMTTPAENTSGRVEKVVLAFNEKPDHDISNFRPGDIVILYPYDEGTEPDARQTMVFRSTIESITSNEITLRLRASQVDTRVFWRQGRRKWSIEHDFFESSYGALYRGMHAFLSAPKRRRDLLLLQRAPETDETIDIAGDYGEFDDLSRRVKQARDLFLIIGPPGTGKTSYGLLNTLQEELRNKDSNVLLLSYTNRAVDEICSKLTGSGIDFIRIGGKYTCEQAYRQYLLEEKVERCTNTHQVRAMIHATRVFVGTTAAFNSNIEIFKLKQFGLAIIDEASQILEPHLIGLLSATTPDGRSAIAKMVLIGDHKQLPAVVQQSAETSEVADPLLQSINLTNCRLSLFERLLKRYRHDPRVTYMLTKQGRMHHDIARFANYTFYDNKLREVPLEHQLKALPSTSDSSNGIDNMLTTRRIAFVAIPSPVLSASDKVNTNEARAIAATVAHIHSIYKEKFSPLQTVGVIVPYRNQIAEIRNRIDEYRIEALRDITIDTVERFQGSQRDIIIYGFTVHKYYQMSFLTSNVFVEDGSIIDRKLNVAMTRAREHLVLFGNPELLANNITFAKLLEFAKSINCSIYTNLKEYLDGNFTLDTPTESDPGQGTYPLSAEYAATFGKLVTEAVKSDSRTQWPNIIFGRDIHANMEAIAYGRADFSQSTTLFGTEITPRELTQTYCHYLMRLSYCCSKTLFEKQKALISDMAQAYRHIHFIDIGCGPATSGIAFAELFHTGKTSASYIGIDTSAEMRKMGGQFLTSMFGNTLEYAMPASFNKLGKDWWKNISAEPSLVIFNFAGVFSSFSSQFSEHLAYEIIGKMREYPHNIYLFAIQHSGFGSHLNPYNVFIRVISQMATNIEAGHLKCSWHQNGEEKEHSFDYEIYTNS